MKYLILLMMSMLALSCRQQELQPIMVADGQLAWYGDPASDGCGLLLEVDSTWYQIGPIKDLYITFQPQDSNSIAVKATFQVTGPEQTVWGCTRTPIKILTLRRR